MFESLNVFLATIILVSFILAVGIDDNNKKEKKSNEQNNKEIKNRRKVKWYQKR